MENALSALSAAPSIRTTAPRPPAAPKPAELPMAASALTLAPANPPSPAGEADEGLTPSQELFRRLADPKLLTTLSVAAPLLLVVVRECMLHRTESCDLTLALVAAELDLSCMTLSHWHHRLVAATGIQSKRHNGFVRFTLPEEWAQLVRQACIQKNQQSPAVTAQLIHTSTVLNCVFARMDVMENRLLTAVSANLRKAVAA